MATHSLDLTNTLQIMRSCAVAWAERPSHERLRMIGRVAGQIAIQADQLTSSVYRPAASAGEILASEVLPVAEACRFVATHGNSVLRPKRLSSRGRAWWMGGIAITESRHPLGLVLIIGPSNYPLFLNAVPMIQAIAAGNAVLVKPAPGCEAAMHCFHSVLSSAGIPTDLIHVLDSNPEAAKNAMQAGVDKVIFTGSLSNGKQVAQQLAETLTPAALELSGNDAVLVLDGADVKRVATALAYAMSLNGGQTCIAPRRLFASSQTIAALLPLLEAELTKTPTRSITSRGCQVALRALDESVAAGARLAVGSRESLTDAESVRPVVLTQVTSNMTVAREDLFAPLLSVIEVSDTAAAVRSANDCPYALGASIFGDDDQAMRLAGQLRAPCVTINDVIVPTADPRVSFGGRGASGYGMTRGLEGLRELTQLKVTCQRRGNWMPHLSTPPEKLATMLRGILLLRHGPTLSAMASGVKTLIASGRK